MFKRVLDRICVIEPEKSNSSHNCEDYVIFLKESTDISKLYSITDCPINVCDFKLPEYEEKALVKLIKAFMKSRENDFVKKYFS